MKTREERFAEHDAWKARRSVELERLTEVFRHPSYPHYSRRSEITPDVLAQGYEAGIIPKAQLKHGAYYFGQCRNAHVARWDADRARFTYIRHKFGDTFPEDICVPEDDNGFDLFIAVAETEPEDGEQIPEDWKGW